jgi:putative acetyltransferase
MSLRQEQPISLSEVAIRKFQPGDEASFRSLNEEWISRYFRIEPKEAEILSDPKGTILDPGGQILFALLENRCVGCCALRRMGDTEYEVAKMAVTPACQGAGIGRKLLEAVMETARALGAKRLFLETNHTLTPAIRMYESVGFTHIPPERRKPSPYLRADVYMEFFFV